MRIPGGLKYLKASPEAEPWFRNLPVLLEESAAEWDLTLGEPFELSHVSYTLPVQSPFGPAVLKLQWPHPECLWEADALAHWNGAAICRVTDYQRFRAGAFPGRQKRPARAPVRWPGT